MVVIRGMRKSDFGSWLNLRRQPWPDCPVVEHKGEMVMWTDNPARFPVYGAFMEGHLVGFLEISVGAHHMVPDLSKVFYAEGLFVDVNHRTLGIARRLMDSSTALARANGFDVIFSDPQIAKTVSAVVHERVGFAELKRTSTEIIFRKELS